jgi:hypothetical protein
MKKTPQGRVSFAGIFLCSFSALAFEITLTRIFSISLWYHFAYMVISIGMLGIGMSGTAQSVFPGLKKPHRLETYALLLGVSALSGYLGTNLIPLDPVTLAWGDMRVGFILLYYLLLGMPFFFFGLIIATSFAAERERPGLVYGADLLGAGAGSVAVIGILGIAGPERCVYGIALTAFLGALCFRRAWAPTVLCLLTIILIVADPAAFSVRVSPFKDLSQAMRYPGAEHLGTYQSGVSRIDAFRSPLVRHAPGLSLRYLDELPEQVGFSTDASAISALTRADDKEAMAFLGHLPPALAYEIRDRTSALVINPRGGLPLLLARHYGTKEIDSVELNRLFPSVINEHFPEFSGGIYAADIRTGLARSVLVSSPRAYDVIDLSLTGSVPSALFGLAEDYELTLEAFEKYLSHLTAHGVLSLSLYIIPPPRTEFRLMSTAVAALENLGIPHIEGKIAVIRSWGSLSMLAKTSDFTPEEIRRLRNFAGRNGFDVVYYPGIRKEETNVHVRMDSADYDEAFTRMLSARERQEFLGAYLFDVRPVTDDNPFFHFFLKTRTIGRVYEMMGGKWQFFISEGFILPAVLLQAAILSLALLMIPALFGKRRGMRFDPLLLYFAFIGLGFMFVEVPLIQKMILPLEHPSSAVAAVLASLLVSSGAGSLLSQRYPRLRSPYVPLVLALLLIPHARFVDFLSEHMLAFPLALRLLLCFLVIVPVGVLMGTPFPAGMGVLGRNIPSLIPWAWAVNGCFSVLAPAVATLLAVSVGFRGVFSAGALMYLLAFLAIRMRRGPGP